MDDIAENKVMVRLSPTTTIELAHRAYHLRTAARGSTIVAAGQEGPILLVRLNAEARVLKGRPRLAVSPHSSKLLLSLIDTTGKLVILDFEDSPEDAPNVEYAPPPASKGSRMPSGFEDCFFDETGEHLWCVARTHEDEVEVQLRVKGNWEVAASVSVEDPFGASGGFFYPTVAPETISLWLAAGQDGQQVYWVRRVAKALSCTAEACLRNTTAPAFSTRGDEFLAVNEGRDVCKFSFPTVRQTGRCLWTGAEDDCFGESLCFLNAQYALVSSANGRIFFLDVSRMRIINEVAIEYHEPRPEDQLFPGCAGKSLCTNIEQFTRTEEHVVFVSGQNMGDLTRWKSTLHIAPIKSILDNVI